MSYVKIRRCHISCRVESIYAMRGINAIDQFTTTNGRQFPIHNMTSAYNIQTKEARIYAEFERVDEKIIEDNMQTMGVGSVVIDSFSSGDWESSSVTALRSVVECGAKSGFILLRHGNEPKAGNHSAAGGGGIGNEATGDEEEEHFPCPRTDRSDEERQKRRRAASPGDRGMVPLDVMMDKMSAALSSVVASAINSSGLDRNREREDAKSAVQMEQQRREFAENQLQKFQAEMQQKLSDQIRIIEEEAAAKYGKLEAELQGMDQSKVVVYCFLWMWICCDIVLFFSGG